MPRDHSLKSALGSIASTSIKERQEGLDLLRDIFSVPQNCQALQQSREGLGWLQVFQTLFGLVKMERQAALKKGKGASAAIARLQTAAGKVRWLVQVSCSYISSKTVNALFSHLTQCIVDNGSFVDAIAMDYIKALKVLLSFPAHLEHLHDENWRFMMSIIWDSALGRKVQYDRNDWDDEAQGRMSGQYNDGNSDSDEDEMPVGRNGTARMGSAGLKRSRAGSMAPSMSGNRGSNDKSTSSGPVTSLTPQSVELLSLFPTLLSSSSAPILPPPRNPDDGSHETAHRAGIPLLHRVLIFLEKHPSETSSHRPVLQGLNVLLDELELNAVDEVTRTGLKMFPRLVKLWGTRDLTLREQVLIALGTLLPFLGRASTSNPMSTGSNLRHPSRSQAAQSSAYKFQPERVSGEMMTTGLAEAFADIRAAITRDAGTKRGTAPLELGAITLLSSSDEGGNSSDRDSVEGDHSRAFPLRTRVFEANAHFTNSMTVSWAALQLYADCLLKSHNSCGDALLGIRASGTEPPPTKRARRDRSEAPLTELLRNIQENKQSESRLLLLQAVYFLLDRHYVELEDEARNASKSMLQDLLVDSDLDIQQWAFLALSVALQQDGQLVHSEAGQAEVAAFWTQTWTLCIRRTTLAAGVVCRCACYLTASLMASGYIDQAAKTTAVEGFFQDIVAQGPSLVCDGTSQWVTSALQYAENDSRLYRRRFDEQTISWFRQTWRPASQMRSKNAASLDEVSSAARTLLCHLLGVLDLPSFGIERPLLTSPVFRRLCVDRGVKGLRDYCLFALLPERSSEGRSLQATGSKPPASDSPTILTSSSLLPEIMKQRAERVLQIVDAQVKEVSADLDVTSPLKIGAAVRLTGWILTILAVIRLQSTSDVDNSVTAVTSVLDRALGEALGSISYTLADRASMLSALRPILGRNPETDDAYECDEPWPLVITPNRRAGVTTIANHTRRSGTAPRQHTSQDLLVAIWRLPGLCEAFASHTTAFRQALTACHTVQSTQIASQPQDVWQDDDFGPIRQEEDGGIAGEEDDSGFFGASRAASIAIEAILNPPYYSGGMQMPTKDRELYNALIESENASTFVLGQHILRAIEDQRLMLTRKALISLSELIRDLLQIYVFKKSPLTRQLIYRFLRATVSVWTEGEDVETTFVDEVLPLWHWCGQNLSAGRLENWKDRHVVLMLLEEFIYRDRTERRWQVDDMADPDNTVPSSLMLDLIDDNDIRIRTRLATTLAVLFQNDAAAAEQPSRFYLDIAQRFKTGGSEKGVILTRILVLMNVIIGSSAARRAPFFHLYDCLHGRPGLFDWIKAAFDTVAGTLHLTSLAQLYLEYAPRVLLAQSREEQDPFSIPVSLYGFEQRASWANATLKAAGPFILLAESCTSYWEDLAEAAKVDRKQLAEQQVPIAVSFAIATQIARNPDADDIKDNLATLWKQVKPYLDSNAETWDLDDGQVASIFTTLFRLTDERQTVSEAYELLCSDTSPVGKKQAATYRALLIPDGRPDVKSLEEAMTPKSAAKDILATYRFLRDHFPVNPRKIIVNGILKTLSGIGESCLLNERRRLLYGLALLLAVHAEDLVAEACFDSFMHATAALFKQEDLCDVALTFLVWATDQLLAGKATCKETVPILSTISNTALELSSLGGTIGQVGQDALLALETFMGDVLTTISRSSSRRSFSSEILRLAARWPRPPPSRVVNNMGGVNYSSVSNLAHSVDVVEGKFMLSRPLARCAGEEGIPIPEDFRQQTFWHLRAALAQYSRASHEDAAAFVEVFYEADGTVEMPHHATIDCLPGSTGVAPRTFLLRKMGQTRSAPPVELSLKGVLTIAFDYLREADLVNTNRALSALAGLVLASPDLVESANLPNPTKPIIRLLASPTPAPTLNSETIAFGEFLARLDDDEMARAASCPAEWACHLARTLIAKLGQIYDKGMIYLLDLAEKHNKLAQKMIPPLLHLVLHYSSVNDQPVSEEAAKIGAYYNHLLKIPDLPIEIAQIIIQSVLYLRNFVVSYASPDFGSYRWLPIHYKSLAEAALKCNLVESGLLFWEIYRSGQLEDDPASPMSEADLKLVSAIYDRIDEPDGFYGVPLGGDTRQVLLQRLKHEDDWTQSFNYRAAEYESRSGVAVALNVAGNMQHLGFNYLAASFAQEASGENNPLPLDLAWRTRHWDVPIDQRNGGSNDADVYQAIRSVHLTRDPEQASAIARSALQSTLMRFAGMNIEDQAGVQQAARSLLCLREVNLWHSTFLPLLASGRYKDPLWETFAALPKNLDYTTATELMQLRRSLLHSAKVSEGPQLGDLLSSRASAIIDVDRQCLTLVGALARKRGDLAGAIKSLTSLHNLTKADAEDHSTEFAEVLWMQGQHSLALSQLKRLVETDRYQKPRQPREHWLRANAMSLLGHWTAEAKQADAGYIRTKYFGPAEAAVSAAQSRAAGSDAMTPDQTAVVLLRYAQFADQQYQAMIISEQHKALLRHHERQERDLDALKKHKRSGDYDIVKQIGSLQSEWIQDEEHIKQHNLNQKGFLGTALNMYAKVIASSDAHNRFVLRFAAMWLSTEADDVINGNIRKALRDLPAYKFVDLVYQLTARLTVVDESSLIFHQNLYHLVERICQGHPFHVVYQVITLAAAATKASRRQSANLSERERAAHELLQKLKTGSPLNKKVEQMEKFARTAILWAREDAGKRPDKDKKHLVAAETSSIASLRNLDIPIATLSLPIDPSERYKNIIRIQHYQLQYTLAGGIHHPKIMIVVGDGNHTSSELFKAGDDTRQDTVMEQVFGLVNQALKDDSETQKRHLHMRTYNVLTLAEETGVIEFVSATKSLADWLLPAHERYHPTNILPKQFRAAMAKVQEAETADRSAKLVKLFTDTRARFQPVMRHFFVEKKKEPIAWFAMRLAYARSLAVSNIVGYILGIGDRHCSNILIDQSTGELVHIDFGVAFGQGRSLPIPELIPFRLTADLEDALGTSGLDGVYRRCAENTLRVLREASDQVLAILEVFKHDPLHRWKITAETMRKVQEGLPAKHRNQNRSVLDSEPSDTSADSADRALSDVANKLSKNMSVEYTVNDWNRAARAPENLAVIFVGWQPWL